MTSFKFTIEKQGPTFGYTNPHNELEYSHFESEDQVELHYALSCINDNNLLLTEAFLTAIESENFCKLAKVLIDWEVGLDTFENLHDVCDPNQALIDAFFQDEDFDDQEAMDKTVERSNFIMAQWDRIINILK